MGCAGGVKETAPVGETGPGKTATDTGPGGTDTDTDTDTAPPDAGPLTDASCAQQLDNALRFDCTVRREPAGAVEIEVDGRVYTSSAEATDHVLTVWGLREETAYAWTARADGGALTGELTTGSLPANAIVPVSSSGASEATDALLMTACGFSSYAVMVDGEGQVVWYQGFEGHGGIIDALTWSDAGTVVALIDNQVLVEITPEGQVLAEIDAGALGLTGLMHHDIDARGGRIYALYAFAGETYVLDGVYVFDTATGALVGDVDTSRWYDVDAIDLGEDGSDNDGYWSFEFPGLEDATHANSVYIGADGELLVSMKDRDAIFAADGEPESPTFGEVDFVISGLPDPAITPTLTLDASSTADVSFDGQHCVLRAPDGQLTVLDNKQRGTGGITRGLWIDTDVGAGTATITREVSLGSSCPEQGAIYALDDGAAITTCAAIAQVREFAPDADAPRWTLDVECSGPGLISRAIPVQRAPLAE